ncbi:hypothetical protein QUB80_15940 [Chlorogloeopsis sp. ULAP01]|uniref:hypothetical protein n=1 Tax=Chlorogloeopsis sp. ULAP01 TaxID=3056483 RepID=UPI0025AAA975|nr:hypothetical protein [Chlorogloeopsis sp. ULAP01]MDM9382195.1 hypothetical protein [Chlorogloeopsis sp. ULAP01]
MHHFNFKSLSFYSIAIGSVLLLFKTVTTYGEKNLQAPPQINGHYRIVLTEKLSPCNQSNPILLNLYQSGIYLNGFLSSANTSTEKLSAVSQANQYLTGKYQNSTASLSGQVSDSVLCNNANIETQANTKQKKNSRSPIRLYMQLVTQENFTGQIIVGNFPKAVKFTATLQQYREKSQ